MIDVPCKNHPKRLTTLRCGKCEQPICTACIVQTPVGARCRQCAQLRRLPQYEVGPGLLLRSMPSGLAVSIILWLLISTVPYLRYFLAIIVGFGVGEVMSRLSRRRSNLTLEIAAVVDVVVGLLVAQSVLFAGLGSVAAALGLGSRYILALLLPAIIASVVAVLRLR